MNASQRRTIRRTLGIKPGATIMRLAPGKAQATPATVVGVDPANPSAVIVRRRDKREVSWPVSPIARLCPAQHIHA